MSETSFVLHELRHLPSKRGTATVNIKFDQIKQIDDEARRRQGGPGDDGDLGQREERGICPPR